MRIVPFIIIVLILLINGCSSGSKDVNYPNFDDAINYNIKEPWSFPFEVNEISTDIDIDDPDYLHQFIFYYKNKQSGQELKYILSKVIKNPEENIAEGEKLYTLENGKAVYYTEDEKIQRLSWETEDGFSARFVYFVNEGKDDLGNYKLEESELIRLANQVQ